MIKFEIVCPVGLEPQPQEIEARACGMKWELKKRSLDARGTPVWRYQYQAYSPEDNYQPYKLPEYQDVHKADPVIVVGAGPAGMFAALKLLSLGCKPIILERGKDVHGRKFDMAKLSKDGTVNPDSNYCFGEGGAGAFSDGKLYTRSSKRGDIREVLHQLVKFGASEDILTDAHPHIGTDKLPAICENIRKCILEHGGEYHFGAKVCDIKFPGGGKETDERPEEKDGDLMSSRTTAAPQSMVEAICCNGESFRGKALILATGHSARDIYELFDRKGWALEAKGFALGVRVEHPQELIDRALYKGAKNYRKGKNYTEARNTVSADKLPAAEYSFVEQVEGRGVFSFCMCPGGILVPSSTEPETVVLNGMSNSARNSKWANSGVVVQIEPEDVPQEYKKDGALALLNFQRDIERRMYNWRRNEDGSVTGNPLAAPAQRMVDFCKARLSAELPQSSYHPGTVSAPLHQLLPQNVSRRLQKAFPAVDKKIRGYFTNEALLLGVESRTSSPVRIPRDPESLSCVNKAIFPCGEGAGYSGGIVSSAIDGIRCAIAAANL